MAQNAEGVRQFQPRVGTTLGSENKQANQRCKRWLDLTTYSSTPSALLFRPAFNPGLCQPGAGTGERLRRPALPKLTMSES